MENKFQHLTMTQHIELLTVLQKFEELFNGTLGPWKIDPVDLHLNKDAKPIYLQPYPVPKVHKEIFKKEVERLVLLGVLEVENYSPSFASTKLKSNRLRFLSDFKNINEN